MPFSSQSQRGLFYAAAHDPAVAKRAGLGQSVIHDFISHDSPGKLPKHVGHADGGDIDLATHIARQPFQSGGFGSGMAPWWERSEARDIDRPMYGFAMGTGGGRTDKNNVSTASGSYVLPADVVSGLGAGNSLAGASVIDKMMRTLPYGAAQMSGGHRGAGPPHAPAPFHEAPFQGTAKGGGAQKKDQEDVPIATADGEIILHPDQVAAIGATYLPEDQTHDYGKALGYGHQILDGFVKHVRGRTIKDLQEMPGPKNSDDPEEGHKEAA
jgi:hypothetical protein